MCKYWLKNYFLFFLVLVSGSLFSQRTPANAKVASSTSMKAGAFIDVNTPNYPQSNFSAQQLIEQVLLSGNTGCGTVTVSNVVVSPNLGVSDPNRAWGYFNKGTTAFPFDDGVVLSSGFANKAGNTMQTNNGDNNGGGGDADLAAALNLSGTFTNAAFLQFDFVPTSTQVKFNYMLASEEYNGYQCSYADGFALLLKKVTDPTYTNIAVLPNGIR